MPGTPGRRLDPNDVLRPALNATSQGVRRLDTNVATVRRAMITVATLAAAGALAVPAAQAGQVVWLASNARGGSQLWAANDDGTYPHRLIGAADTALASQLAAGTLGDPDVFQNAGATVLFTDATNTASPLCALPCARAFSLTAGVLADQSPAPASDGAGFESQPRLTSTGGLVEQYLLYPSATASTLGAPASRGSTSARWARARSAPAGRTRRPRRCPSAPTPPLIPPTRRCWRGSISRTRRARASRCTGRPVCQYAIHLASAATVTAPPIAIFDDEAPFGPGPSSLALSTDGRTLLIVDDASAQQRDLHGARVDERLAGRQARHRGDRAAARMDVRPGALRRVRGSSSTRAARDARSRAPRTSSRSPRAATRARAASPRARRTSPATRRPTTSTRHGRRRARRWSRSARPRTLPSPWTRRRSSRAT